MLGTANASWSAGGQDGALAAAARWIEVLIFGPVATSIATLTVAAIGLAMLVGRVSARRAVGVIVGCFILFGAPAVASGLSNLVHSEEVETPVVMSELSEPLPVPPAPPLNADPYAGASVPM